MPPHCDSKDGPVVQGALRALDTNNVEEALRFAPEEAEAEIRTAFENARQASTSGPAARDLSRTWFAETVVRLHRAGEGAPYTGLKPAGLDVGPVIPVAERAIETGSAGELEALLGGTLHAEVARRMADVTALKARSGMGLADARAYTSATLGLQVWSHKLHQAMHASAHEGHEAPGAHAHGPASDEPAAGRVPAEHGEPGVHAGHGGSAG